MSLRSLLDGLAGAILIALTVAVILDEWGLGGAVAPAIPSIVVAATVLLLWRARVSRFAFVAIAVLLTLLLSRSTPDWPAIMRKGFASAAFIAAFFTALSTLRNTAEAAPAIRRAGRFLAMQPPGRRYLALTAGGQLFALLLNYGAIALLGALATASAREEPDEEVRLHRTRRMLLAIQRGFISVLPWSPLSFAVAITTVLIPGAEWSAIVLPGLVTAALIAGTGYALDTIFKPRLSHPVKPQVPEGSWELMLPLLGLLAILVVSVVTIYEATGIRVVGIVLPVVPLIALVWAVLQSRGGPAIALGPRLQTYVTRELPGFRNELVLLMMAGYIGTVGAPLLLPLIAQTGFDAGALPVWVLLVSFVWLVPLLGQVGMNPILAVTLIAPLVPAPEALGVSPAVVVVAITAGWALGGASSPFTATTLLIGSFANVSATHVGLRWNGAYTLICATILSGWVVIFSMF